MPPRSSAPTAATRTCVRTSRATAPGNAARAAEPSS
ncbi:hypothetical protein SVEN_5918 [Streptomyces venezuelae ATCC 10712]|uniref:Uncharacterized protein n=1 Tax=Streptomyces venezuelae (strain ATCC 10712 / CBS 650.69 / DSM 40230 / JCM 4526 / NBRC 13096 / PD 04745) TaxID=953739 RepID=F2RAY5_STRVP|nr:hypothetical protein SVEN_5918 [Streptomyces venezuelae ATCC 10712]